MVIDSYKFTHNLRVRWSEVDSQKVVFNANYLNYFDIGVTEYYKAIGCPYLGPFKEGQNCTVAELHHELPGPPNIETFLARRLDF